MTRRHLLTAAAAAIGAPMLNLGRCRLYGATARVYSTRTIDLVGRSLVIDMLGLLTMDWTKLGRWQSSPAAFSVADFENLRQSGVNVLNPSVDLPSDDPFAATRDWLTHWQDFICARPDCFQTIDSCKDLDRAKQSGRIGLLLGMQNSDHFRYVSDVALFSNIGQRISQLTYNGANRLGHGCAVQLDLGLSAYGGSVVSAMNSVGMVIDVSHAGEQTTLDAIEASKQPVLITHSNCRALVPHPRCKSDTVIKAMARKGGVMGITGVRTFLSSRRGATINDVLDHFDHVTRLVGPEHIGIGSDAGADGGRSEPHLQVLGMSQARRVFDVAEGLLSRRYSEAAIEGILGRNFQRALGSIFCS